MDCSEWLKANSPGGWIDDLRESNRELVKALQDIVVDSRHRDGQPLYCFSDKLMQPARAALYKATRENT